MLHREGIADSERAAGSIADALKDYPHWITSEQQSRELRKVITKILLEAVGIDQVTEIVDKLFRALQRVEW